MKVIYFILGFLTAVIFIALGAFLFLYLSGFGRINPAIKGITAQYSISATITDTKVDTNGLLLETDISGNHPKLYVTKNTYIVLRQDSREVKGSVSDIKPNSKADLYLSYIGSTRQFVLTKVAILTTNLPKVSTSSATTSGSQR